MSLLCFTGRSTDASKGDPSKGLVVAKQKKQTSQAVKDAQKPGKVARTKARRDARRTVQEMAASLNRVLRSGGEATPWERAKAKRRAKKHGAGLVS